MVGYGRVLSTFYLIGFPWDLLAVFHHLLHMFDLCAASYCTFVYHHHHLISFIVRYVGTSTDYCSIHLGDLSKYVVVSRRGNLCNEFKRVSSI
jgi:hypothetical protein